MNIKVSNVATSQLVKITSYYASHFGLQAANNLADSFERKMEFLAKFPEAGHPEPLAKNMIPFYRSIQIAKHINVIYFVDYLDDSVRVSDIWDTRMNPETLKARLSEV